MNILDFFTGGVFTSFKELLINGLHYIVRFFSGAIGLFLSPIIDRFFALLPDIDISSLDFTMVNNFLNYTNFVFDATFMTKQTFNYIILSLIFRVGFWLSLYIAKLMLSWWDEIV